MIGILSLALLSAVLFACAIHAWLNEHDRTLIVSTRVHWGWARTALLIGGLASSMLTLGMIEAAIFGS